MFLNSVLNGPLAIAFHANLAVMNGRFTPLMLEMPMLEIRQVARRRLILHFPATRRGIGAGRGGDCGGAASCVARLPATSRVEATMGCLNLRNTAPANHLLEADVREFCRKLSNLLL